ncbi:hypothetical protein PIB30_041599 [Stylosanthes scabra]|uniref:Uncharacterized protein n=1 Tax=Stylosanthes scabra TaxID=79078 RepID=A0ABU6VGU5_9FABA|nr:hypothetical protein [Stylosanthes scabra]
MLVVLHDHIRCCSTNLRSRGRDSFEDAEIAVRPKFPKQSSRSARSTSKIRKRLQGIDESEPPLPERRSLIKSWEDIRSFVLPDIHRKWVAHQAMEGRFPQTRTSRAAINHRGDPLVQSVSGGEAVVESFPKKELHLRLTLEVPDRVPESLLTALSRKEFNRSVENMEGYIIP